MSRATRCCASAGDYAAGGVATRRTSSAREAQATYTVQYALTDGTAHGAEDHLAASGSVNVELSSERVPIRPESTVTIVDDDHFGVTVSSRE